MALEISEFILVVFPAYPTVWIIWTVYWLKEPGSCVSVLYISLIKEPDCLFEVRARRIVRRACLYLVSLTLFWGLTLSLSLWLDHAVSALEEDAPAPLWLQHDVKRI